MNRIDISHNLIPGEAGKYPFEIHLGTVHLDSLGSKSNTESYAYYHVSCTMKYGHTTLKP